VIILGISLLRLGDLVLQRPLIESLRERNPHSEIHLLINKQFSQIEFLFEGLVDRFIYFDREVLQKSCGESEFNIFWGLEHLKSFVDEVNKVAYDYVYNLTHNRLTAHLAGLVRAKTHVGIYSKNGQFLGLNNPWIQFFNSYFGKTEALGFHYTEILAKALGTPLNIKKRKPKLRRGPLKILIQPLTSDKKKNWGLEKYRELQKKISAEISSDVKVLGADYESQMLLKFFTEEDLVICNLKEVAANLERADLVITGDTSIKHLAALFGAQILELSLGSSQPLQVGAYADGSIILESRVVCGPCPHSLPCNQSRHLCEEKMSLESVYDAVKIILGDSDSDWSLYAYRNSGLNVYSTEISPTLGWTVTSLSMDQNDIYNELLQRKMMITEELDRRQNSQRKGGADGKRTRKLSDGSAEAP